MRTALLVTAALLAAGPAPGDQDAPPPFAELRGAFEATAREPLTRRAVALRALAAHRTAECVEYLDRVRRTERSAPLRTLAIHLLGAVGVPPAPELLRGIYAGGRAEERGPALTALGQVDPPVDPAPFLGALAGDEPAHRVAAAHALQRHPTLEVARALAAALDDADCPRGVANAACEALRHGLAAPEVGAWFAREALSSDAPPFPDAVPALLRAASACGDPATPAAVIARLQGQPEATRVAAAAALGELLAGRGAGAASAQQALATALADRARPVAVAAAVALGQIGPAGEAVDRLLERVERPGLGPPALAALAGVADPRVLAAARAALLGEDDARVAAAIEVLAVTRSSAAVDALVGGLRVLEAGRPRAEAARALRQLTRADLGEEHEGWSRWWGAVRDGFELPDPDAPLDAREGTPRTRARPTYHGNEVVSRRVAFLIDVSYSMASEVRVPGSTVPITRLEACKRELLRVIDELEPTAAFNVVAFANQFALLSPRAAPARKRRKREAREFVDVLVAAGGTNIYDPLAEVLADGQVDTVWLLSDGDPTDGAFTARVDVLREVRLGNAARRAAIHCIAVGQDSELLRDLAREHRGSYHLRGVPEAPEGGR